MVYIGVDLHRKKSQVAALDQDGKLLFNRKVSTGPAAMQQVIDELRPQPIEVAFEATYGWGWFADQLAELGVPAHMAHPLAAKAVSSARVKNDAVDAKTLAHLLRTNLLPEGWIAPAEVREARRLVRMRASLVRLRAKLKAQVHALLGEHGIQPEVVDLFGKKGRSVLDELQLPAVSRSRLGACLRLIDEMTLEIVLAEREIYDSIKEDERVKRLLPIPGIGPIIAATILSEIGDITRFTSADKPLRLGRADARRALQRRQHPARPHLQAGLALAPLGHGRGSGARISRRRATTTVCPHLPAAWRQDRSGRGRATVAHARLLCAAQRNRLPQLSHLIEPKGRGALDGCHGLSLRRPPI